MKLLLCAILCCASRFAGAQNMYAPTDTIFSGSKAILLLKQTHVLPPTYTIETFTGEMLVTLYPGKTNIEDKPCYIISFVKDGRQALVPETIPHKLVQQLLSGNVLKMGSVNTVAVERFIKKHPVPKGYQDVEQIYNY